MLTVFSLIYNLQQLNKHAAAGIVVMQQFESIFVILIP
jgi:hypothetical protein